MRRGIAINNCSAFRRMMPVIVLLCSFFLTNSGISQAYEGRFLAHEDIILYGMGLKVEPARQVVPKNIATIVSAYLQVPTLPAAEIPMLAADALVKGTLRGPGLEMPLELSAKANTPFNIPPLTVPGMYSLDNIRLESGGEILFRGTPESVSIEIIEKLLVSQITARPLSAQEIRDKGIVYDKNNFQAYNFTAAFAIGAGDPIQINMPVVLPKIDTGAADRTVSTVDSLENQAQLTSLAAVIPATLHLAQTKIPNLSVRPFALKMLNYTENSFELPPIPGVIVIPGDIGFLNQYFSVMLMVANVAPAYSNLVVKDITATILLPAGPDNVAGSTDDPLRMANTDRGLSPLIQPVVQAGLDGKLGTADDIVTLAPGESGNAEYLVEGLREGSHTLEMEITGTLTGLPVGPVTVSGRAAGAVLVRNPKFTLTFTHPDVVNSGEEYALDVTVTNTSEALANFVSINLNKQQIGGADLVGEGSKQIETLEPGDSATVSFDLRAKVSGTVFAATLDSDENVSGRFALKTAIGELGIPLSPDSLVLPKEAGYLAKPLRDAAIALLGKAYAVATAPAAALPKGIQRFGKKIVWDRAIEVAEAGFRISLGEPTADNAKQLLLDFMGSNFSRLAEFNPIEAERLAAVDDFTGFDALRRSSIRGDVLADAAAALLLKDLTLQGGWSGLQNDFARKINYRPEHISIMLDAAGAPLPVSLTLVDSSGRALGGVGLKGKINKEIPFSDYLTFKDQGTTLGQMALLAVPEAGAYTIRLEWQPGADPAATFNLGLVVPDAAGVLQQLTYNGLAINDLPQLDLPGSSFSFSSTLSLNGVPKNGTPRPTPAAQSIPDAAPTVLGVVQQHDADVKVVRDPCPKTYRFGRVVAALFSEEVTAASVQDKLAKQAISNYAMEENQVVGVALQPGRRIAFLALRDPVGRFIPRSVTFNNIADRTGNLLNGQNAPIVIPPRPIEDAAATVSGTILNSDGTTLAGAEVRLFHQIWVPVGDSCGPEWYPVSNKNADGNGRYAWDYLLIGSDEPNKVLAIDRATDEFRAIPFSAVRSGQRLNVNVVLLGRATLKGRVLAEDGVTPLSGAQLAVTSLTDNSSYGATTASDGSYVITRIPVGNILVQAVHVATHAQVTQSGYLPRAGETVTFNLMLLTEATRKSIQHGSLVGHVLRFDGATAVKGVPVYAWYQDNSQSGVRCPASEAGDIPKECPVAVNTTDAGGAYRFVELPAGGYRLYTFDQAGQQDGTARLDLGVDQAANVNILLNGGFATVTGVVRDAAGDLVAGAEVGGGLSLTTTAADGSFTLTDVPLGARTLVAVSQAIGASGKATITLSTPGASYPVTIFLEGQGGIYGTVLTANNSAVADLPVYLLQLGANEQGHPAWLLMGQTTTTAAGGYSFPNVAVSGEPYVVSAFLPDLSDGNLAKVLIRFAGERLKTDITFRGKASVTGGIFDSNGTTPLVGKVSISAARVVSVGSLEHQIPVAFEYTQHLQIVDTTFANNQFTFSDVFLGDFVVTAAGPFSPDPVTFPGKLQTPGETVTVNLRLTDTSTVTGIAYGPDGKTPLVNALVSFGSDATRTICTKSVDSDGNPSEVCRTIPQGIQQGGYTQRTDAAGRFTFALVNAGTFTLKLEERDAQDQPTGRTGSISGLVLPGATADMTMRLKARSSVKVTVYTHTGTVLVANASVRIEQGGRSDTLPPSYQTNSSGEVLLDGMDAVDEGAFVVSALSSNGFAGRAAGRVVLDSADPLSTGPLAVNVYLFDSTVTVKGTVYRPDGITPVPNAEVHIYNQAGDLAYGTTDAAGRYQQEYIPLGDFKISVFEAASGRRGFGSGTAVVQAQTVTVNITERAIGEVAGTVLNAADLSPLRAMKLYVSQQFPADPSIQSLDLQGTSGPDGRFTFPGVSLGQFTLKAYFDGSFMGEVKGNITREGEQLDIPFLVAVPLQQSGDIIGTVYHFDATPAPNTVVCLAGSAGVCSTRATTADTDGVFRFTAVPLGKFQLRAASQNKAETGVGYGTIAFAGDTPHVKVVMEGVGSVTGTVLTNSQSFAGAKVTLAKSPDAGCGGPECIAQSDAAGRFSFTNVPAGQFTVYAANQQDSTLNGAAGGVVSAGSTADVEVALTITGTLHGAVRFANDTPAAGVVASLRLNQYYVLYTVSDADGRFTFTNVRLGQYRLELNDPASSGIARRDVYVGGIVDQNGNPLILDEAPPTLQSITPLPNSVKVDPAGSISIVFSEPVQTPGQDDISFAGPVGPLAATVALSADGRSAVVTPVNLPLADMTLYMVRISGIRDLLDRIMPKEFVASFTTRDTKAPLLVSRDPAPGSSGAPLESVVRIMFNEPVVPASFLTVTRSSDGVAVAGRVDMVFSNTGAVFTPTYPLAENTAYTVTVLPATDLSGNTQSVGETFSFTSFDRTPPVISSLTASPAVIENGVASVSPLFVGAPDIALVDYYLNGAPAAVSRTTPFTFSFQALPTLGLPGGSITVTAYPTDTSGNRGAGFPVTIPVIADAPPTASVTLSDVNGAAQSTFATGSGVKVSVAATDDTGLVTLGFQADGGTLHALSSAAVSPSAVSAGHEFYFTVPVGALSGSKITVQATAVDRKGQTSKSAPVEISVADATPPQVLFAGLSSGAAVKAGQQITAVVSASDSSGITRIVFTSTLRNVPISVERLVSPALPAVSASFTYTVPNSVTAQDVITFEATAYDASGNSTAAPAVLLAVVDSVPPQVALQTATGSGSMPIGQTMTIVVTAADDSALTSVALAGSGAFSYSDSVQVVPATGQTEKRFTISVPAGLVDGALLTLVATATDTSGNTGQSAPLILTARELIGVQLPSGLVLKAGESQQIDVTLGVAAPSGGYQVDLVSSNASQLRVQPNILIFAAGETVKNTTLIAETGGNATVDAVVRSAVVTSMQVAVSGGIVTGVVKTSSQTPVAGAQITINGSASTTSATDGSFSFAGIAGPGVAVTVVDTTTGLRGAASGSMNAANGYLHGMLIILSEAGSISGTVKLADQTTPAPVNVTVRLFDSRSPDVAVMTTFTDALGTFSFSEVPLARYTVDAQGAGGDRGQAGVMLSTSGADVPVTVSYLGRGTLSGTVKDAGGAAKSGLTVTLNNTYLFGNQTRTDVTASDGSYAFADVFVGSYALSVKDTVNNQGGAAASGSLNSHGQAITANLTLAASASVEGHVYRIDGTTAVANVPVQTNGGMTVHTDSAGYYRFEVLPLALHLLTVSDAASRTKGEQSVQLKTNAELQTRDIFLSGSAILTVTVQDETSAPVPGATVLLNDSYGSISAQSDSLGVAVFNHAAAGSYQLQATAGALHGSSSGQAGAGASQPVTITVAADPTATISGVVLANDGGTPVSGMTVVITAELCGYSCSSYSDTTAGDGSFSFPNLLLGSYSLLVRDSTYLTRANLSGIVLASKDQVVQKTVVMSGLGSVSGRVLLPGNAGGAQSMAVTVKSSTGAVLATVFTDAAGYYSAERLPLGLVSAAVADAQLKLQGTATGTLASDGQLLTLDIQLIANGVTLPQNPVAGNAVNYDVQSDGSMRYGMEINKPGYSASRLFATNAGVGAAVLILESGGTPTPFPAVTGGGSQEEVGQETVLRQDGLAGLTVTRKVYVPTTGYFARYLEILDNPTAAPITVTVKSSSNFNDTRSYSYGSYSPYFWFNPVMTSSGDAALQPGGDSWAVFSDSNSNATQAVAFIWSGSGVPLQPGSAVQTANWYNQQDNLTESWTDVTVAPGERVAFMHFIAQEVTSAAARAAAERLVQLPPEALAGLAQDELLAIRNFRVPTDGSSTVTPLPQMMSATVTATLKDYSGANVPVVSYAGSLQSSDPLYGNVFSGSNQVCGYVGYTWTCSYQPTITFSNVSMLRGPFSVTASRYYSSNVVASQTATGDFLADATTASVDVVFSNTGNLTGLAQYADGSGVGSNGTISLYTEAGMQITTVQGTAAGNYLFQLLPPGSYLVQMVVYPPSGGNASTEKLPVTITAGQTATVDLLLPKLVTVSGRLMKWDGTAITGSSVYRVNTITNTSIGVATDSNGLFTFVNVQPGSYRLRAYDSTIGSYYEETFTVDGSANVAHDLRFRVRGYVTATVIGTSGAPVLGEPFPIQVLDAASGVLLASCTADTATASCTTSYVLAGSAGVKVQVQFAGSVVAENPLIFTAMDQTLITNLQLAFDPVSFPKTLTDGNNLTTAFNQDGTVMPGDGAIFNQVSVAKGVMALEVGHQGVTAPFAGASASGTSEDGGREIVTRQDAVGGVNVTRKIFVAKDGYFARYLDIFTNPSATDAITVDLVLTTNFDSTNTNLGIHGSSSGIVDEVPQARNLDNESWAIGSAGGATSFGTTNAAIIWKGAGGSLTGSTAGFTPAGSGTSPSLHQAYSSVVLQPGQKLALLRFLVQMPSRVSAQASAERLVQLPPEALVGLSAEERGQVVNFAVPADGVSTIAPLPALNGEISVQLKGWDGAVQTTNTVDMSLSQLPHVTFVSSLPQYPFPFVARGNGSGLIVIAGVNSATAMIPAVVPVAPFIIKEASFTPYATYYGYYSTTFGTVNSSEVVNGTFADGSDTASVSILFTETGSVAVTISKTTTPAIGSAVTVNPDNIKVWAGYDPACSGSYCTNSEQFVKGATGSYNFAFLRPQAYLFLADLPAPSGTNPYRGGTAYHILSQTADITASQTLAIPVNLTLGTISGRVLNTAGNPVSGNRVKLTRLNGVAPNTNYYQEQDTFSGTNGGDAGSFVFTDLPEGNYRLEVQQLGTNNWFYYAVTLAADEAKTADYTYQYSGTVSGTITWADGVPVKGSYFLMEVVDKVTGFVVASNSSVAVGNVYYSGNAAGYYSLPVSAGSGPLTLRITLSYYVNGAYRTILVNKELAAGFTGNGQILTVDQALPVYYNRIQVKVEDANHAPLMTSVPFSVLAPDGSKLGESYYSVSDTYTTSYFMSENPTVTVRAVFNNTNFDVTANLLPSESATPPSVVIMIPLVTASLQGTVTAGDGVTPFPLYFNYTITRGNGDAVPCGQRWYYNYYGSSVIDVYANCTTYDGTFGTKDINGALRTHPFLPGETLKLTVQGGNLYALGTLSTTFTFPAATTAANITAAMPVFAAKGNVTRPDASAVEGASVTMVVTDAATPPAAHTYSAWTDSTGVFTLLGTTTGAFTLAAQTNMGAQASYAGGGTITNFATPLDGLNMTIEPTGTITGIVTRGGSPLSGADVTVISVDTGLSYTITSDSAGRFSALDAPFGAYSVTAAVWDNNSDGQVYSNTASAMLTVGAPTADVQLAFDVPPGTVFGTILDNVGGAMSNTDLTLTRVSDGVEFYLWTDSGGNYLESNLTPGGYLVSVSAWGGGGEGDKVAGSAYGILTDGGTLKLDLNLRPEVQLGTTELSDATFKYGVGAGGTLEYGGDVAGGYSSPFNYLYTFYEETAASNYSATRGWFDLNGQFVLAPAVMGGKVYQSKLYMPAGGGYLRYLEIISNPSAAAIPIIPEVFGSLVLPASGSWSYVVDPAATAPGYAIEHVTGDALMPQVGMVLQGSATPAAAPWTDYAVAGEPDWYWKTDAPAGDKACIMHFIFQGDPSATDLEARAQALRDLDGTALTTLGLDPAPLFGLTADERACIKNFNVPPAP